MLELAVGYEGDDLRAQAETLASTLNLPLDNHAALNLWVSEAGLGLKKPGILPVIPDFSMQTWDKRRKEGKKQALIRACNPAPGIRILDVSAGWGRDAAILASFGAEVTMLERNPLMAVLLKDALSRQDETSRRQMKLSLIATDALFFLEQLSPEDHFPVIYMDPMHPERQKSALVKKDLQLLQQLIGEDKDAMTLLNLSIQKATQRVVVKWPQSQKALLPASSCIPGKTIRYDLFIPER